MLPPPRLVQLLFYRFLLHLTAVFQRFKRAGKFVYSRSLPTRPLPPTSCCWGRGRLIKREEVACIHQAPLTLMVLEKKKKKKEGEEEKGREKQSIAGDRIAVVESEIANGEI